MDWLLSLAWWFWKEGKENGKIHANDKNSGIRIDTTSFDAKVRRRKLREIRRREKSSRAST